MALPAIAALLALVLAASLPPAARGEELARAHVVVTKSLPGVSGGGRDGVVMGRPFEILYSVKNVGADEALDVGVIDEFPAEYFSLAAGSSGAAGAPALRVSYPRLAPGANRTERLVLVPKVAGTMKVARAHISYKYKGVARAAAAPARGVDEEEDEDAAVAEGSGAEVTLDVQGLSTTPGKVDISKPDFFARRRALRTPGEHVLTWSALGFVALVLVAWPWQQYVVAKAHSA